MAEFGWDLPEDVEAAVAYVHQQVAEAQTLAERDAGTIYKVTPRALHRGLHPCNCVIVFDPFTEGHVWLNGSIDGKCGHPASRTPYKRPQAPAVVVRPDTIR